MQHHRNSQPGDRLPFHNLQAAAQSVCLTTDPRIIGKSDPTITGAVVLYEREDKRHVRQVWISLAPQPFRNLDAPFVRLQ